MAPRIIRKYEQFLKEAGPAPAAPPPSYQRMDMNQGSRADAPDTYKIDFSKDGGPGDGNVSVEGLTIQGSEWGIEGFNPSPIKKGFYPINEDGTPVQTVAKGYDSEYEKEKTNTSAEWTKFRDEYNAYLQLDSTGGVGKKLLILPVIDVDGQFYVQVDPSAAKTKEIKSSIKEYEDNFGRLSIFTEYQATRDFDLNSGLISVSKQEYDKRFGKQDSENAEKFYHFTGNFGNQNNPKNRAWANIRVNLNEDGSVNVTKPVNVSGSNYQVSKDGFVNSYGDKDVKRVGTDTIQVWNQPGTSGYTKSPAIGNNGYFVTNADGEVVFAKTSTGIWRRFDTPARYHQNYYSPMEVESYKNPNSEGNGTLFNVDKTWPGTGQGVEYVNSETDMFDAQGNAKDTTNIISKDHALVGKAGLTSGGVGVGVPMETQQFQQTLEQAIKQSTLESAKKPQKQQIIGIKWNNLTKKWELTTRKNTENEGDFRVNGGYWVQ